MRVIPETMLDAVCPFCAGNRSRQRQEKCPRCGLTDTPATRQPTSQRLGPWFYYQPRNPAAPGMNWATLCELIASSKLNRNSIVRGPTSGQMWVLAERCRGVSRELGLCWKCQARIGKSAETCDTCHAVQTLPADVDRLLDPGADPTPRAVRVPQSWLADAVRAEPPTRRGASSFRLGQLVLAAAIVILLVAAAAAVFMPEATMNLGRDAVDGAVNLWRDGVAMLQAKPAPDDISIPAE